jgi:hypothetical protein
MTNKEKIYKSIQRYGKSSIGTLSNRIRSLSRDVIEIEVKELYQAGYLAMEKSTPKRGPSTYLFYLSGEKELATSSWLLAFESRDRRIGNRELIVEEMEKTTKKLMALARQLDYLDGE